MSERKARRGRPKGSEIDDSGQLRAIAKLIADEPDLKPTTAIRSLGISDPSTIRRLRDKYNSRREQLEQRITAASQNARVNSNSAKAAVEPPTQPTAYPPVGTQTETRTMALDLPNWNVITEAINKGALNGATPRKSKPDNSRSQRSAHKTQGSPSPRKPQARSQDYVEPAMRGCVPIHPGTIAVAWWSVGIKSWATMAGINLAACQKLAKLPTAQAAVRQQVELNNLMMNAILGMGKPKKFH